MTQKKWIVLKRPNFFVLFQVIAAEGEQKASRALREAANVIAESSSALQVIRNSVIFDNFRIGWKSDLVVSYLDSCSKGCGSNLID